VRFNRSRVDGDNRCVQFAELVNVVPKGRQLAVSTGGVVPDVEGQHHVLLAAKVAQTDLATAGGRQRKVWRCFSHGERGRFCHAVVSSF
jgi:hypothetical protein